ncbi:hypothetical protein MMC14_010482, partial [Varicellaria rhodocarpa]|nr:hypothetical protein [Varicellaria rhodocarpa]
NSQLLNSLLTPHKFLASLSRYPTPPPPLNPSTLVATTQLGLMYLIIAALTLITFHVTIDAQVVKGWLATTAAIDVLYIYSFHLGMGDWKEFGDVRA